jgi:hypothetical protein
MYIIKHHQNAMQKAIDRFHTRLSLPSRIKFRLISTKEHHNEQQLAKFKNNINSLPILELYHSSRDGLEAIESIFKEGFGNYSPHANKGPGTYFADHSRYGLWAGYPNHVLICHVIANETYMKRHISEIKSGSDLWTSEFVATNPQMIYPRYLLTFHLDYGPGKSDPDEFGWTKNTRCNNEVCVRNDRCDCPVFPLVMKCDIVDMKFEGYL